MDFKAVIFDLDGTLLDTLEDIAYSANIALAKFGFPKHPSDTYRGFIGHGVVTLMTRALPHEKRDANTIEDAVKAFREAYSENWNVRTRPFEGISEMLRALAAKKVKTAIHSNKPADYTERCARELLTHFRFEMVVGQSESFPRKPDPAGALKIAETLGISPSGFLYVGDSGVDMETASRAGMLAVGVTWGFRSQEELLDYGAMALIHNPMELLRLWDSAVGSGGNAAGVPAKP